MTKKKKNSPTGPKVLTVKDVVSMLRFNLSVKNAGSQISNTWIAVCPYGSYSQAPGYHNLLEVFGTDEKPVLKPELRHYEPVQPGHRTMLRCLVSINQDFPGLVITWKDVYLADKDEPLTDTEMEGLPYTFSVATADYIRRAHRASTPMVAASTVRRSMARLGAGFANKLKQTADRLDDASIPPEQRIAEAKAVLQEGRELVGSMKEMAGEMKEVMDMQDSIEKIESEEVPVEIEAQVTPADTPSDKPIDVDAHHATCENDAVPDDRIPEFDAAAKGGVFPDGQPMPEIHPEVKEPIEVKPASPDAENEAEATDEDTNPPPEAAEQKES